MKQAITTVLSKMSNVVKLRAQIKTEGEDLDHFEEEALQTIGNAEWSNVEKDLSMTLNNNLDALTTATANTITDLAQKLLLQEDKEKLVKLWNQKLQLDENIVSIHGEGKTASKEPSKVQEQEAAGNYVYNSYNSLR